MSRSDESRARKGSDTSQALPVVGALTRMRLKLGAACSACPERSGSLRRELACRCPVALAARCLLAAERHGLDTRCLPDVQRASLRFQERALPRCPPAFDADAASDVVERLQAVGHAGHDPAGCLACHARTVLENALLARPVPTG